MTQHMVGLTRRRVCGFVLATALLVIGPTTGVATAAAQTASREHVTHLDPGLATSGAGLSRVIVTATDGTTESAADAVRRAGGVVRAHLAIVDGVAATVRANALRPLAMDSAVLAVTADRKVQLTSWPIDDRRDNGDRNNDKGDRNNDKEKDKGKPDKKSSDSADRGDKERSASSFVGSTGARTAWANGNQGAGVGVALIDTGVSDVNDLAGRIVHGPDLSGEGTSVDTYGHGTVMAGLIAGNGADSGAQRPYTGVAPRANVVAVKVAGRDGSVDVTTVLQAMHWVAAYRTQFNIRVLNLSWGVPSTQSPSVDPVNHAVERLWRLGIVVVAAAGNSGPFAGSIVKPADDPMVLTVGAYNDRNDEDDTDDVLPVWSSRGPTADGVTKPDLVSPGRRLIAARSFGSTVEQANPSALIGPSYIRGSGTSEATAVASGVAALLLAQRPDLTPDEVKYLLRAAAHPLDNFSANQVGTGRLHLTRALTASAAAAPRQQPASSGTGSIEGSRGGVHVLAQCSGTTTVVTGEIDVRCEPWDSSAWVGTTWTGDSWTGTTWTSQAWTPATWTGTTWTGGEWLGGAWQGGTAWTGTTWTGTTWTGTTWTGTTWTSTLFFGVGEAQFLTAFWGDAPPWWKPVLGEATADVGTITSAVP
ncbi:MAG: serine protease AprX [Frankiales bacterium]|jgi:serine protease AprX|nr:serine protease AprX [Frankiales bacterium]